LLGYYLYYRNRKMKLVADLKAGANTDADIIQKEAIALK